MTLSFSGLGALVVVLPLYVFLVGGLLSPFFNCQLLRASSILVSQSHNSPNELIGNDKSLLLIGSKFLMIMLIWSFSFGLLTILDALLFHLVVYSENVSPMTCLVVFRFPRVTSIMELKMNWSTNKSTSSFHTLALLGSRL